MCSLRVVYFVVFFGERDPWPPDRRDNQDRQDSHERHGRYDRYDRHVADVGRWWRVDEWWILDDRVDEWWVRAVEGG